MKRNAVAVLAITLLTLFVLVPQTWGVTLPTFASCLNPQGDVKASYARGTHGIAGDTGTHAGSDTVYVLSEGTLTQCFCGDNGQGIETHWLEVVDYSETDIQVLKSQGWIYIPNGSVWGLSSDPYMALNADYSCNGGSNSGGNSGSSGNSSSNSNNSSSSNTGGVIESAIASAPQVLGLADTGNSVMLYGVGVAGVGFLLLGLYLLRQIRK